MCHMAGGVGLLPSAGVSVGYRFFGMPIALVCPHWIYFMFLIFLWSPVAAPSFYLPHRKRREEEDQLEFYTGSS